MEALIEKELLKFKTHIIDYASIKSVLQALNYVNINDKIKKLKQKGMLQSLKKELYVHQSLISKHLVSKEICANTILGPSYISLDYALYFHGIIPESVHGITSITTKRSKSFQNYYGLFTYQQIKKELFPIGLQILESQTGNFLMASKEKALCDKIYFTKGPKLNSIKSLKIFLKKDLRVDLDEFNNLDTQTINTYYEISKSKKIKLLIKLTKEL